MSYKLKIREMVDRLLQQSRVIKPTRNVRDSMYRRAVAFQKNSTRSYDYALPKQISVSMVLITPIENLFN